MSAESTLTALSTILPVSTTVATTLIETELDAMAAAFPALLLFCPRTEETRKGAGLKGEIHTIHVQYLDRWESSTRTVAQLTTDARTALNQMKANVRADHTLGAAVLQAGDRMETEIQGVLQDLGPFPLFSATLVLEIWDKWFQG